MKKSIYDLKLGEDTELNGCYFTRVPGGWIVNFPGAESLVFVPYSDEFKV